MLHADSRSPAVSGLEGVIAADTRLSDVDGEGGRLVVAGHSVEALADGSDFESASHLLFALELPNAEEREATRRAMAAGREQASRAVLEEVRMGSTDDAIAWLSRTLLQLQDDFSPGSQLSHARLTGALGFLVAHWARLRSGRAHESPDLALTHAEDVLRLLVGAAEPGAVIALNRYWVTVIDHGLNASTFVARVVASTRSDLVATVVAALGALKGPLHGGAPGPVCEMLDQISVASEARPWLERELALGRRIMGMGHRIYRVRDPRAAVLERALTELESRGLPPRAWLWPERSSARPSSPSNATSLDARCGPTWSSIRPFCSRPSGFLESSSRPCSPPRVSRGGARTPTSSAKVAASSVPKAAM